MATGRHSALSRYFLLPDRLIPGPRFIVSVLEGVVLVAISIVVPRRTTIAARARRVLRDEGVRLFEQVLVLVDDLLLLPEEIDPGSRDYLGNFPLALSQAGLVHAVIEVQKVIDR